MHMSNINFLETFWNFYRVIARINWPIQVRLTQSKIEKLLQNNYQNQLTHSSLSHTEQECQESLMQGKMHIQQKRRPRILVKLSFREFCGSKLSGLHPFDNIAIIHLVKNRLKQKSRLWVHETPILEVIFVILRSEKAKTG